MLQSVLAAALGVVASHAQTTMDASGLPLFFEANHGQRGVTAPYFAHGPNAEFLLSATNMQFVLHKQSGETATACMRFLGANEFAAISGMTELTGKVNYLVGNNPEKWQIGVPTFEKVRLENIYPGVNVVYYGNGRQLEYDFDLAAGVDPKVIAIRFDGAKNLTVDSHGNLVVSLNGGQIVQHAPIAYQMAGNLRHEITGGYKVVDSNTATFALGNYDHGNSLVIDPILSYSTYFGGNSGAIIHAIALGNQAANEVFVAGETTSSSFSFAPTNGYQTKYRGNGGGNVGDAFIAKFGNVGTNVLGTNFIYFTYLGGSADDAAYGLAVDTAGHAYVTGATTSSDFPTTNAAYSHFTTNSFLYTADAFVTELETNGASLLYSTYLVGNASDIGTAIAVDASSNAYVTGYTYSTNFPTRAGAYQSTLQCTNAHFFNANAFLTKIAPNGNLAYSSYFGGNNFDKATAIALDGSGNVYIAGYTASTNLAVHPLTNAPPLANNTVLDGSTNIFSAFDAFVAEFPLSLASPTYSTYLGGSNYDVASGVIADGSGNVYVVGSTTSTNFPVTMTGPGSCVLTNTAGIAVVTNSFLTKIGWNGGGPVIEYSLLFGGNGNDVANGISKDGAGNLYVIGSASSTNFPVTPNNLYGSLRATNSASNPTQSSDAVITAFDSNANLLYSAYLGGPSDDQGTAIAADSAGNVYIAGQTASTVFPTFNAVQTNLTGSIDGFIAKILPVASQPVLHAAVSGTNLLVSWQGFAQETPTTFLLVSKTNLLSTNAWSVVTNWPATNSGTYIYSLPHTNAVNFFRLQQN